MQSKMKWAGVAAFLLMLPVPAMGQQVQHIPNLPNVPNTATAEQVKEAVAPVRAGKKLTPKQWPNNAKVAVCISFDVDNEYMAEAPPLPATMSEGEYGATTGLVRVLDMLDKQQIPASFYIPAVSAILHPDMIKEIQKSGRHEIGVHGWIHEYLPTVGSEATEEELLKRAVDYLTKATGKKPAGYRAPAWAFSPYTLGTLLRAGFLYDSSLMAMDQPYEIMSNGKDTGLMELPVTWILDDYPYYGENADGSMPHPESVFDVYKAEFDGAYEEGTLFLLTMHPHISGHRSRIAQVDKLITYIKSKPGVWFATEEDVAKYLKEQGK
jgi:peptidoglycan/xylan/chitin deacetylase (PgdA/CDA1 family)